MMTRRASEAASSVLNFLAGRKLLSHAETLIKAAKSSTKIAARTFGLYTATTTVSTYSTTILLVSYLNWTYNKK